MRAGPVVVTSLTPEEVFGRLHQKPAGVVLLDVREPDERALCLIDPSIHIPLAELPSRFEELPRDREVVVYCHHGSRSTMAAAFLESVGFRSVANLQGGIDAWSAEVDSEVERYQ